jgi:hypothetical protein
MTIPRTPLILGLAGLIPFMLGAVLTIFGAAALPETIGMRILLEYSRVILAFISGVLWGFAAKVQGWNFGYALSTLPALWAFFASFLDDQPRMIALAIGFAAILGLDFAFRHLAPQWWLGLRMILSAVVLTCLGTTIAFM